MASRKANLASVHSSAAASNNRPKDRKERTTRTDQEKRSIVAEYKSASRGEGKAKVLAKHGITASYISNWSAALGMGSSGEAGGAGRGVSLKKFLAFLADGPELSKRLEQIATIQKQFPFIAGNIPNLDTWITLLNQGPELATQLDVLVEGQAAFAKLAAKLQAKQQGQQPMSRFG